MHMKIIYLGAGEFWLLEAVYGQVKGVTEVIPGYMGGTVAEPSHEMVATGTTGHAEVVKVSYDEKVITTEEVLRIFFALHDPAVPNHNGLGIGSQYRNIIFYTEEHEGEATNEGNGTSVGVIPKVVEQVQATMPEGVTVSTPVVSAGIFYPAHESHYNYYTEHPDDMYSTTIIKPKLLETRKRFPDLFL
jgi:peptide-methionine (S)-S-oxide reductase